ncbi:hypothetical protein F5X99DRAFT_419910 [Biscogniauxia marginata]|nr:hypothetical protein F5X99DRAFT_419910 [Biscogniauxia marginata]
MRIPSSSPSKEQHQQKQRVTSNTNTSRFGTPSRLPIPRFRHPTPNHHHTTPFHPRLRPLGRQSISGTINNNNNNKANTSTTQDQPRHSSSPSCSLTPATDPDLPSSCIPNRRSSIRVIKPDLALLSPVSPVCQPPPSSRPHQQSHPHLAPPPITTIRAQQPAVLPTPARESEGIMNGDGDKYSFYYDSGDESAGGGRRLDKGKGQVIAPDQRQSPEQEHERRDSENNLRLSEAGRYQLATMFSNHEGFQRTTPEPERAPPALASRALARDTPPPNQAERRGAHSRSESLSQPQSQPYAQAPAHVNFKPRKQLASASSSQQQPQHKRSHSRQQTSVSSTASSFGYSRRDNSASDARASPFKTYQHHQRQNSNNNGRGVGPSSERGRPLQRRRYELTSDDESEDGALSTVQETRQSNMTTITDLIRQGLEQSPSDSPSRSHSHQGSPPKPAGDSFVPPVPALPTVQADTPNRGHRPTGLNMDAARKYGQTTGRHANIKAVHKPVPESPSAPELSPPQQSMLQVPEPGPSRGRQTPAPVANLDKGKKPEYMQQENQQHATHNRHNDNNNKKDELRYSSSVYEWDDDLPTISPLRIPRRSEMMNVDILQQYNEWWKKESLVAAARRAEFPSSPLPRIRDQTAKRQAVLHNVRSRSEMGRHDMLSSGERITAGPQTAAPDNDLPMRQQPSQQVGSLSKSATMSDVRDEGGSQFRSDSRPQLENLAEPFTPLTPWLVAGGLSNMAGAGLSSKTKSKILIGEDGYLENTAAPAQVRAQDQKKKSDHSKASGFFDKFKSIAREFAENSFKPYRTKPGAVKQFATSLDPREQSLVYCELEFNLSNALDEYIKAQLNSGRLSPDKLKRVADAWAAQGRPRVTGFRYDLETQVDLVAAHIDDFRFCGDMQLDPVAISGLLHSMRMNARQMRARTYCQPDTVIFKHLSDALSFMRLIGTPEPKHTRLEQVAQFFKTIVAREKAYRQKVEERERLKGEASNNNGNNNDNGAMTADSGIGNMLSNANEQLTDSLYGSLPHALSRFDEHRTESYGHSGQDNNEEQTQTQTQEAQPQEEKRQFSGPILEPKTYSPTDDEPAFPR